MLKSVCQLEKMDKESEDIYQTSLIDRYAARPDSLENLCLAEFAANYITRSIHDNEDGDTNDAFLPDEDQQNSLSQITLKNNLGSMYKCSQASIIHFYRFNHEKETEKLYRSKLMLYLPWRDESSDLLREYPDFRTHYENKHDVIPANERKYSRNATLISEAMDDLTEYGLHWTRWLQVQARTMLEMKQREWRRSCTLNRKT